MFGFSKKEKVSDPVCGMKIDKEGAKFSSVYQGEKYLDPKDRKLVYFCSAGCKQQFDSNPMSFLDKKSASGSCC